MVKILYNLIYLLNLLNNILCSKYISLDYSLKINLTNKIKDDLMKELFYIGLYTDISIGNPLQKISVNINLHKYPFFVYSKNSDLDFKKEENIYDYKKSNSFYTNDYFHKYYFYGLFYVNASKIYENLYINNIKSLNNELLLVKDIEKGEFQIESGGSIGLELYDAQFTKYKNCSILYNYKKNKLIYKEVFSFIRKNKKDINKFFDEDSIKEKGSLIIGDYLNEIYNKQYEDLTVCKTENIFYKLEWAFKFDYFRQGNFSFKYINQATLYNELGVLIGTYIFFNNLNKTFFNNNKYCFCDTFYMETKNNSYGINHILFGDYYYYYCTKDVDFTKFENLYFYQNSNEFVFNFTYKDLFYYNKYDNNYYFLIIGRKTNDNLESWYFGLPFFNKYQISFNSDQKIIGYYKIVNTAQEFQESKEIKKEKINGKIKNILFVISIIIIIILSFTLFKVIKLIPRKKKANELKDEFLYQSKSNLKNENNTNSLGIDESVKYEDNKI